MAKRGLILFVIAALVALAMTASTIDPFTMSVNPPPVPGQSFTITWTPNTSGTVDILLNNFDPENPSLPIITTSSYIATNIPNSGSYVWQVPADLSGRHSFSIETFFEHPVSYSEIFVIGAQISSSTSITRASPTATTCVSPATSTAGTGANPFTLPSWFHVRAGRQHAVTWNPTSSGPVTIYLVSTTSSGRSVNMVIADNIENGGSFTWTPDVDLADNDSSGLPLYGYYLNLVDTTHSVPNSTSDSFYVTSPSYINELISPGMPVWAVIGQPYSIYWDASNTKTISLILQSGPSSSVYQFWPSFNYTVASHITNNGGPYIWHVPTNTDGLVSGEAFLLAIVDDATGHFDSRRELLLLNSTPLMCDGSPYSTYTVTVTPTSRSFSTASYRSGSPTITNLASAIAVALATSCSTGPIEPTSSSLVLGTHTIIISSVGCLPTPTSTSIDTTATVIITGTTITASQPTASPLACQTDFAIFATSLCCPTMWTSTSFSGDTASVPWFCYTKISSSGVTTTTTTTTPGLVIVTTTSTTTPTAGIISSVSLPISSPSSAPIKRDSGDFETFDDTYFIRAGVVNDTSSSSSSSSSSSPSSSSQGSTSTSTSTSTPTSKSSATASTRPEKMGAVLALVIACSYLITLL